MAVDRPLTILNLYDIYANFIPGIAFTLYLIILVPFGWPDRVTNNPGVVFAGLIIYGIILGQLLQWAGSRLDNLLYEGAERVFINTLEELENPGSQSNSCRIPFVGNRALEDITPIERDFLGDFQTQFRSTRLFNTKREIFYLTIGYLMNKEMDRTARFQALHAFFRSMWAGVSITLVSLPAIFFSQMIFSRQITIAFIYNNPRTFIFSNLIVWFIFYDRKRKFEELFVRHVFHDFYQATNDRK